MKKFMVVLTMVILMSGGAAVSHASSWGTAGKILTGIEGMRILTGGRFDVVGSVIGSTNGRHSDRSVYKKSSHHRHSRKCRHHVKTYPSCRIDRVWVPSYEWHKKHIPAHEEYDDELGTVQVEEHYIKYRVEDGGYWKETETCH